MWRVALDALWATDKTVRDALAAAGAEPRAAAGGSAALDLARGVEVRAVVGERSRGAALLPSTRYLLASPAPCVGRPACCALRTAHGGVHATSACHQVLAAAPGLDPVQYSWRVARQLVLKRNASHPSGFGELDTPRRTATGVACHVSSIHRDWQWNAFMFGPLSAALLLPLPPADPHAPGQRATMHALAQRVAAAPIVDYYNGAWLALSSATLNGDLGRACPLLFDDCFAHRPADATAAAAAATATTAHPPAALPPPPRPLPLVASPQTQAIRQGAACVATDCQGWCSEHYRESHCSNCKCQCPFCESGRKSHL